MIWLALLLMSPALYGLGRIIRTAVKGNAVARDFLISMGVMVSFVAFSAGVALLIMTLTGHK